MVICYLLLGYLIVGNGCLERLIRIPHSAFRIPHSAFRIPVRIPHSAFRIPHSAFRIPHSFPLGMRILFCTAPAFRLVLFGAVRPGSGRPRGPMADRLLESTCW